MYNVWVYMYIYIQMVMRTNSNFQVISKHWFDAFHRVDEITTHWNRPLRRPHKHDLSQASLEADLMWDGFWHKVKQVTFNFVLNEHGHGILQEGLVDCVGHLVQIWKAFFMSYHACVHLFDGATRLVLKDRCQCNPVVLELVDQAGWNLEATLGHPEI